MSIDQKKPCIQCDSDCDILPIELGDSFTLTYLRVCSAECLFIITYEYLYEISYHKGFRNKLWDMQNEEDKNLRNQVIENATKESLKYLGQHLKINANILSCPFPDVINNLFSGQTTIGESSQPMRFTKASKEKRLQWQREHIDRLNLKLKEALEEMEKIKNDH